MARELQNSLDLGIGVGKGLVGFLCVAPFGLAQGARDGLHESVVNNKLQRIGYNTAEWGCVTFTTLGIGYMLFN